MVVLTAFLAAVALHTSWDVVNTETMPALVAYAGMVIIAGLSLFLLIQRYREARTDLPTARDLTAAS
jgi:hypothetical protein